MNVLTGEVNNYLNPTQPNSLIFNAVNKEVQNYLNGKIDYNIIARDLLKKSIDTGSAIVSVLSNTGIAGFKFNLPQREQAKMQSDVTDHYVDTNSAVQDHIALKPVTITLQGLQGEYFYSVNQIEDALALVTPTISLVKQFIPKLPVSAQQAFTKRLNQVKNYANFKPISEAKGVTIRENSMNNIDLFKLFQDIYKLKSSQTRAFMFFEALWQSKALFTVETTWKRYENMIIIDVQPLRDNNADITDFTVRFKQINVTASLYRSYENAAGRTREQLSEIAKKGLDKGKKVSTI